MNSIILILVCLITIINSLAIVFLYKFYRLLNSYCRLLDESLCDKHDSMSEITDNLLDMIDNIKIKNNLK